MTTRTRNSAIGELRELYEIGEPEEVTKYLRRNPGLTPLVVDARARIATLFGAETPVALRIVADPEIENFRLLWALICVSPDAPSAAERLDELDESWWLAAQRQAAGKFAIDIEYV